MADPVVGLREMARVTQSGGVVAACVWDLLADGGLSGASGQRCASSIPMAKTSRSWPVPAGGTSASCSGRQVCMRSRRAPSRLMSNIRVLRNGGSRSCSALALPARTLRGSTPGVKLDCATSAERNSPKNHL
ncbi:MAG: hypothetical protein ACLPZR_04840 [Solirubrobacteraceae bacterium]